MRFAGRRICRKSRRALRGAQEALLSEFGDSWIGWNFIAEHLFKMLPVVEETGERTFHQTLVFSVLLVAISVLPTVIGMTGQFYLWGALLIGLGMLSVALDFAENHGIGDARRLLKASVLYLPLLLLFIVVDAV